jgi:NNP family nitrate/nitrite transporter-like MFS transporter
MKKYQTYALKVDPDNEDRADEYKLCNFSRPHMRAFHCSWWAFFIAFFIWFAIAPLMPEIKKTLNLDKQEIWTSNIVSVSGTILMRFILGPACDKYGARALFSLVLCLASIPVALTGLVQNSAELSALRFFIGLAGGTFVMCQYWTSVMFTRKVVGTVNGLVAGWGNLGGGVTHLVMGTFLFPLFERFFHDSEDPAEKAWRTVCIVPAVVAFTTGVIIYFISDDAPKGNYSELKKNGLMPEVSAAASFRTGALNFNTWIYFLQYGCCFGVELTMYNAAALYFNEQFGTSTENSAAIASIFGWMNLFARGLGGYISDKASARMGMRGRLLVQTFFLATEGAMVLVFAVTKSLAGAIVVMTIFSILVQAANGSTFGIVPYINPAATGSVSGIVGAGGNTGAVVFGLGFRQLATDRQAYLMMGGLILGSSLLSMLVFIKGQSGLIWGEESPENKAVALSVPEPDEDVKASINKEVGVEKEGTDDDNASVESEHHC